MPLARFQLRNEFGLGKPDLYMEADSEDPKAVLDSVAVAGLVGILRQLGDLAEFAGEVFHGLQEQVTVTASRSHDMMVRVQHIEAALPPLEKRVLVQTSHLHFAYTSGSEWHVRIQNEQHHFIDNDLPLFIMDSYEECRDPPRLHLLDKFDTGGPGSCLSRYSDPTFFRRVLTKFDETNMANTRRDKRGHKIKKRPFPKNGEYSRCTSMSKRSGRMQFSSPVDNGQTSPSVSVDDVRSKFGMRDSIYSFGSRSDSGYIECRFDQNENELVEELRSLKSSSSMRIQHEDSTDSVSKDNISLPLESSSAQSTSQGRVACNASSITWDEKIEILEPIDQKGEIKKSMAIISAYSDVGDQEESSNVPTVDEFSGEFREDSRSRSIVLENSFDEIERENDICVVDDRSKSILLENSGDDCEKEADNCVMDNMPTPILLENSEDEIEGEPDNCVVDDVSKPILHENQVDDVDSEADSYVDALNNIESESETDHGYQMKLEINQHLAEVENTVMKCAVQEPMSQSSIFNISGIKSNCDSAIDSNKEMPSELCGLGPRESSFKTQIPEAAGGVDNSDCFPSNMFERSDLRVGSNSKRESDRSAQPPSDFFIPATNEIPSYFSDSPIKLAAANFWTNGGLLGLQPSKPADFAPSNNADAPKKDQDSPAGPSDHNLVSKNNGDKMCICYENGDEQRKEACSNHPTSLLINKDSQSTKKTALVSSLAELYARHDKSYNSDPNNKDAIISGNSITLGSAAPVARTGSAVPAAPTSKVAPAESRKESDENRSGVFGLSQRLFANSFCKRISLIDDVNSEPANSTKARIMEQDHCGQHNSTYPTRQGKNTREKFEVQSLISSLPSSPPLEHMKISFHPVNDFETSKLGLKFSLDNNKQESIRDMFASFQLVPETSVGLHDLGLDSDDDTFYRSSPCTSDGCLSHDSDSNSERWESGGTDNVDALCRISTCSPTPLEQVGLDNNGNVMKEGQSYTSICGPSLNLPSYYYSFESLPKLSENNGDTDRENSLAPNCSGPPPPPPPLPPAEWQASNLQTNVVKEEEQVSLVLKHEPHPKHLLSTSVEEQPQQVNSRQHKIAQDIIQVIADKKGSDEKDDFLHQIRTKSFNLRSACTARDTNAATSIASPTLNANVKVSVIVEKANAIRQVVASDDDSWSDN